MARETNNQVGGTHYKKCGIEPVEYIHANGLDFFRGNIVKYVTRDKDKNGAEDIRKVIDYANMILEFDYGILPEAKIKENGDVVMEEQEYPHGETLDEEIERKEVKEKVYEKERRKMLEREVLDELIEEGKVFNVYTKKDGNRATIPLDIANAVWNRDGGKCCICGSRENLEFDHIIPISKGGATTFRNLQILCKNCNIKKSDNI